MNFQKKTIRVVRSRFSWTYGQKRVFRFSAGAFFGKSCLWVFTRKSVKSGRKVKKITFSENSTHFLKNDMSITFKARKLNFQAQMEERPYYKKNVQNDENADFRRNMLHF